MVSVEDDVFSANTLTQTHGTITDGTLTGGRFVLGESVILDHGRPWVVEWKSSGNWTDTTDGGLLFSEAATS